MTRRTRRLASAAAVVAALTTCVWAAEETKVQGTEVFILKGKGSLYLPELAKAHRGDTLEVEAHEGRWLKVQFNGVEGYALESAVKGEHSSTGGQSSSSSGSTSATATNAARGWDSNDFAHSHSLKTDGLEAMIATRQRIAADPVAFEQFKADGHVGAQ